jgi:hypothetical protein
MIVTPWTESNRQSTLSENHTMNRRLLMLSVALIGCLVATGSIAQAPAATPDPLAPILWMTGTWRAQVTPPGGDKPIVIEQQLTRVLQGNALNFATSFSGVQRYQGLFAYDAHKKAIVFWYPSAGAEITEGTVTQQEGYLLADFQVTDEAGTVTPFQVRIVQLGAEDYSWTIFNKGSADWKPMFTLHYHRVAK